MTKASQATDSALNDFSALVDCVAEYVDATWHARLCPHSYDDSDHVDVAALDAQQVKKFRGISLASGRAQSIECQLTLGSVLHSGDPPLHALVGACISYGMEIEAERQRRRVAAPAADLQSAIEKLADLPLTDATRELVARSLFLLLVVRP